MIVISHLPCLHLRPPVHRLLDTGPCNDPDRSCSHYVLELWVCLTHCRWSNGQSFLWGTMSARYVWNAIKLRSIPIKLELDALSPCLNGGGVRASKSANGLVSGTGEHPRAQGYRKPIQSIIHTVRSCLFARSIVDGPSADTIALLTSPETIKVELMDSFNIESAVARLVDYVLTKPAIRGFFNVCPVAAMNAPRG